jgi:signal transduction histidine kinase
VTRRLLLGYLGLTLFVLLSLEVPLGLQNQRTERRDLTANVAHDATVLAADAEDAVQAPTRRQLDALAAVAYSYARRTGGRVVIVDRRGSALVDTSARVSGAESFASRPEIRSALSGNYPSGVRASKTLRQRLLYVAVPIASGGVVHGAVRVTYPMSTVDARILHYWFVLGLIALVVLLGAALVGIRLARFVTRPLQELEGAALEVGEGHLEARAPEHDGPPEVRSLARVFNETVVKLGQLLRSQEEFVADASHELRTPLTALRLRLENLDASRERDAALREVERLSGVVEALLMLARADAGTARPVRLELGEALAERAEAWRPLADEHGVKLAAEPNGSLAVRAAPERLAQVLDNLLANALEATPRGGTVAVSARPAPGWVELHVRDNGPGMSPEERARAFDRFWRAGTSERGSGLGLAIVRRLVEADEGEAELREAPGGGLDAAIRLRAASVANPNPRLARA